MERPILSKKQLEDAAKCGDCLSCEMDRFNDDIMSVSMCMKRTAQTALAYREALEQAKYYLMSSILTSHKEFADKIDKLIGVRVMDNSATTGTADYKPKIMYGLCEEYMNKSELIQTDLVFQIIDERKRQDSKWGEQNHVPQFWTGILGEEYGEFCEAVNETVFNNGTTKGGYENMKKEAIHTAAVALGFLECLERNKEKWGV